MCIRIGIWVLGMLCSATGIIAQEDATRALAKAVGLCGDSYAATEGSVQPACTECDFYLVLLKGQLPSPELFFLEARSPAYCGSGGCTGTVYQKVGQHYQERFSLFGVVDRKESRPQHTPAVIVYKHRTTRYDFDGNGLGESATVWAQYEWSKQHNRLLLSNILRIQKDDGRSQAIPLAKWRERLLREWRQDSPWVF